MTQHDKLNDIKTKRWEIQDMTKKKRNFMDLKILLIQVI